MLPRGLGFEILSLHEDLKSLGQSPHSVNSVNWDTDWAD